MAAANGFFITKIRTIKDTINSKVSSLLHPTNIPDLPFTGTSFVTFPSVNPAEVLKLINKSFNKSSSMDFLATSLIQSCSMVFSEIISILANLSISQGSFPHKFILAQGTPLLKKPGLDKNNSQQLSSYIQPKQYIQITWASYTITHPIPYHIFLQFQPFPISISVLLIHWIGSVAGPGQYLPCYWQGLIDGADIIGS